MFSYGLDWRTVATLASLMTVAVAGGHGCAGVRPSKTAAVTQDALPASEHSHTPWRYEHRHHRHIRPTVGSRNVLPECSICQKNVEEGRTDEH